MRLVAGHRVSRFVRDSCRRSGRCSASSSTFRPRRCPIRAPSDCSGVVPVTFPTADGLTLHGWFVSRTGTPEFGRHRSSTATPATARTAPRSPMRWRDRASPCSSSTIAGYGGNPGSPTEERAEARCARGSRARCWRVRTSIERCRVLRRIARDRRSPSNWRRNIPPPRSILRSPFTSMTDVGRHHYPWLPGRLVASRSVRHARTHSAFVRPPLVIAGDRDSIVPVSQSRRVFEAANEPKSLLVDSECRSQ